MSAEDQLAIHDLVSRYADAVTRRDADAWSATWAEHGEWQLMGLNARGREALVELWRRLMDTLSFVVQIPSAGIVDVDGERGTGRWTTEELGQDAKGRGVLMLGVYRDDYVRAQGAWLFSRRRLDALYMGPPDLSGSARPISDED